jgi:hypothetical protein
MTWLVQQRVMKWLIQPRWLTWKVGADMNSPQILEKLPTETRTYIFDFSQQLELVGGAVLSAPTVTTVTEPSQGSLPSGVVQPTVANAAVAANTVTVQLGGGTAGVIYQIICTVTATAGAVVSTITGIGKLLVFDPSKL